MSREVKKVDLDFDWYEKTKDKKGYAKIWFGYILKPMICKACNGGKNIKGKNCPVCYGDGKVSPTIEPPNGEGWQMWEDVTEGSPVSPVFKTPKQLAKWLEEKDISSIYAMRSAEEWLKMIKDGWCPTGGFIGGKMMDGVQLANKE